MNSHVLEYCTQKYICSVQDIKLISFANWRSYITSIFFFYQSSRIVKKVPSSLTGSVEKDIEKSSSFRQEYVEQAEENGKTVEKIMIGVADRNINIISKGIIWITIPGISLALYAIVDTILPQQGRKAFVHVMM